MMSLFLSIFSIKRSSGLTTPHALCLRFVVSAPTLLLWSESSCWMLSKLSGRQELLWQDKEIKKRDREEIQQNQTMGTTLLTPIFPEKGMSAGVANVKTHFSQPDDFKYKNWLCHISTSLLPTFVFYRTGKWIDQILVGCCTCSLGLRISKHFYFLSSWCTIEENKRFCFRW